MLQHCDHHISTVDTLSTLHNLTIIVDSRRLMYRFPHAKRDVEFLDGMFSALRFGRYRTWPELHQPSIGISEMYSSSLIYCVLTRGDDESKDMIYWSQPFRAELWGFLIMLMLGFGIFSQFRIRDNRLFIVEVCVSLYKLVGIMIGDGKIRYSRVHLWIALLGLAIGTLYANLLLSLAVKEVPPKFYNRLEPLLKSGYKILPQTFYEIEFWGGRVHSDFIDYCPGCSANAERG